MGPQKSSGARQVKVVRVASAMPPAGTPIRTMLGFKRFDTAAVTITGIELAENIKKHPSRPESMQIRG
jgi:hypothetical protein